MEDNIKVDVEVESDFIGVYVLWKSFVKTAVNVLHITRFLDLLTVGLSRIIRLIKQAV
jgi:hypothetical protein